MEGREEVTVCIFVCLFAGMCVCVVESPHLLTHSLFGIELERERDGEKIKIGTERERV